MRILFFSDLKLPEESKRAHHTMRMAEAFTQNGHHVTLYARNKSGRNAKKILEHYKIKSPFKMELSLFPRVPIYRLAGKIKNNSTPINSAEKPDLVISHDPVSLALFPQNIAVLMELENVPDSVAKEFAFNRLISQPNFKGIVVQNDSTKRSVLKFFEMLQPEQIFVAPDGHDFIKNFSHPKGKPAKLNGRKDAPKAGYIGALDVGKGLNLILRTAEICPDFDFHIIGGSRRQIQTYKEKCKSNNVFFYGKKNHSEIPALLKAMDYVLAPYQHRALVRSGANFSRWIAPMKLCEYMAAQKPILCSDMPVTRSIINHEETGLLLSPYNDEEWADALVKLYETPSLAQNISYNAYINLLKKYNWQQRALALIDFCQTEQSFRRKPSYHNTENREIA